jgi:hypothetical protein
MSQHTVERSFAWLGAFDTGCPSDFWDASAVPGADEAWVIGSNGQLFHYAAGKVTRYETGAPCI